MLKKVLNVLSTIKAKTLALFSVLFGLSVSAYAALPASVAPTVSGIQQDGTDLFDLVFPVIALFVGFFVVIGLFKRFVRSVV